jgi:hypothetical protein
METAGSLPHSQEPVTWQNPNPEVSDRFRGLCEWFVTWLSFYSEQLLAPRPNPKPDDHLLSTIRDCSFNTRWFKYDRDKLWLVYTQIVPVIFEPPCIFADTLHIWRPLFHPQTEDAPCRGDREYAEHSEYSYLSSFSLFTLLSCLSSFRSDETNAALTSATF